MPCKAFIKEI